MKCWEAKPKLDYGLLRWCPKAFGEKSSLSKQEIKAALDKNSNRNPMKNALQYFISAVVVLF